MLTLFETENLKKAAKTSQNLYNENVILLYT